MAARKPAAAKVEPETYTVTIQGVEYPVEKFTGAHLAVAGKIFEDEKGSWNLSGIRRQSEAAEVVKEIIVPTLPSEVIEQRRNGQYVWMIEADEMAYLFLQISQIHQKQQLAKAVKAGDKAAQAEHIKAIEVLEASLSQFGQSEVGDGEETIR